jgi:hypothetical protein
MGFTSLFSKLKIPGWLIMGIAYVVLFVGNMYSAVSGDYVHMYVLISNDFMYVYVYVCMICICIYGS